MREDQDEHSPYFVEYAQPQTTWLEFFLSICRAVALAVAIGFVLWMVKV